MIKEPFLNQEETPEETPDKEETPEETPAKEEEEEA